MTPNYTDTINLRTGKLIQLKAITGKRVAYHGCNLKIRGYNGSILVTYNILTYYKYYWKLTLNIYL